MSKQTHAALPASCYFDEKHFRRELQAIWWQDWICVGHDSEWQGEGDYRVVQLGDQQILVTRNRDGVLMAFHNTCRHRGSLLCEHSSGKFKNGRIVCPYHAWAYSLDGELTHAPRQQETGDLELRDYSLYGVHLDTWAGFVFINLAASPGLDLETALGEEKSALASWPLAELAIAHRQIHSIQCNWKIFWENFLECYHCPGVHPDLCRLVPVYGQGVNSIDELPDSSPLKKSAGLSSLVPGAVTWSADGATPLPWFEGLSSAEQEEGMRFAEFKPTVYLVGHVDYVRSVQVLPLGPEETQLTVSWFVHHDTLESQQVDVERLTGFGQQVVMEDARVCELNQAGLHSIRHQQGVLVPQEHDVLAFQRWVLERLG